MCYTKIRNNEDGKLLKSAKNHQFSIFIIATDSLYFPILLIAAAMGVLTCSVDLEPIDFIPEEFKQRPVSSSSEPSSSSKFLNGPTLGGKTYKAVLLGTQVWMAENLNYATAEGSVCYDDCTTYGRLYDWETAMDVCPSGWHLPSREEWATLTDYEGGFAPLPGGYNDLGMFFYVGEYSYWWSSAEDDVDFAYGCYNYGEGWGGFSKNALLSVRCVRDEENL